jgi:hypothetical protein
MYISKLLSCLLFCSLVGEEVCSGEPGCVVLPVVFIDMLKLSKPLEVSTQSIRAKKASFMNLVDSAKPDIIVGTESWLRPEIHNSEFTPPGVVLPVVFIDMLKLSKPLEVSTTSDSNSEVEKFGSPQVQQIQLTSTYLLTKKRTKEQTRKPTTVFE